MKNIFNNLFLNQDLIEFKKKMKIAYPNSGIKITLELFHYLTHKYWYYLRLEFYGPVIISVSTLHCPRYDEDEFALVWTGSDS